MLETIGERKDTLAEAPTPTMPLAQVAQRLKSLGDRVATLAWFMWGEVTGNKRQFPG
jgi:hypothetical protein